jgi:hypothetical protein
LLLAFELSERVWKLGFTTGLGQRPRVRQIPARATNRILEEIARAKVRFRLPTRTPGHGHHRYAPLRVVFQGSVTTWPAFLIAYIVSLGTPIEIE